MSKTDEIGTFRSVAARLMGGAPVDSNVPALLLSMEELPLVNASLFGALQDAAATQQEDSFSATRTSSAGAAQALASESRPGRSAPEANGRLAKPDVPVFSFRRAPAPALAPSSAHRPAPYSAPVNSAPTVTTTPAKPPAASTKGLATQLFETLELSAGAPPTEPSTLTNVASPATFSPEHRDRQISDALSRAFDRLDPVASELLVLHTNETTAALQRTVDSSSSVAASRPPVIAGSPDPFKPLAVSREAIQSAAPAGLTGGMSETRPAAQIFPHPPSQLPTLDFDADTLASLVNEVLAEQARRHGVDLS